MKDASGITWTYGYDYLDRLTSAPPTSGTSYSYVYDPVGNMTSETVGGTTTMTCNNADQIQTAGSTHHTFDGNGNELSCTGGLKFVYITADQTTTLVPSSGSAISATYLSGGQAQRTAFGSNSYKYDSLGMSMVKTRAGTAYLTKTPDGTLLSECLSTGTYYYLYHGIGSVVALTNSSGGGVNPYSYDPYRNATSVSETVSNPFRYIGGEWDSQTGRYKFGERYYDPATGRFTQLDPLGGGYTYAAGDPINCSAPSGPIKVPIERVGGGGALYACCISRRRNHMTRRYGTSSITAIKDDNGKVTGYRGQPTIGGKRRPFRGRTKTEVQRQIDEAKAAHQQGRLHTGKSQIVAEYLAGWLETKRRSMNLRVRTLTCYELNIEQLVPHIGKTKLEDLRPAE